MNGYICKYAPMEIYAGFSAPAELICPQEQSFELADGLLYPSLCSFAKAFLQGAIKGGYDSVLLTDCCDAMKRAGDALRAQGGADLYTISLPRRVDGSAVRLYASAILKLVDTYEKNTGCAFDVQKFLAACKPGDPPPDCDYIAILGARAPAALIEQAARLCALPVRDLTCGGQGRHFAPPPGTGDRERAMLWYADQLLRWTPCMRMADPAARSQLVDDPHMKGVIYHTIKFCDFYSFEYAAMGGRPPALRLETDYTPASAGQLKTRLQAFFEAGGIRRQEAHMGHTQKGSLYAGIDIGSTSTNVVIINERGEILSTAILPTGANSGDAAAAAMQKALDGASIAADAIAKTVATGYGRGATPFEAEDITEITCHARGAFFLFPGIKAIIDIGGQDSKVIRLDSNGGVVDFSMNDKCAAGTGRFLELMADTLNVDLARLSQLGLTWTEEISISSMCAVFAESEVISLIAQNKNVADIVRGLSLSIAGRTAGMAARMRAHGPYVMTGGVAKNSSVAKALEEKLGGKLYIPEEPRLCGALGAALLAAGL